MRVLFAAVLLVLVAFVALALLRGTPWERYTRGPAPSAVGTAGTVERARETGAKIGEKVGEAAEKTRETVDEASITSKIKAKMVLDDYVKARNIGVTTNGTTVTLKGTVKTVDEHDRAIRLARETLGVSQVVDQIKVGG